MKSMGQVPHASVYEAIRTAAEQHAERVALVDLPTGTVEGGAESLTYGDLAHQVTQTANLFHSLGVSAGDAVSLMLPSRLETQLAFWGAATAGIVNPINAGLRTEQIAEIMNVAGSKVLVTEGPGNPGLWVKAERLQHLVPTLEAVVAVDGAEGQGERVVDFGLARESQAGDRLDSKRRIEPDELVAYFHTGGTTGTPKLAQHTHRNEMSTAWGFQARADFGRRSTMALGLPLFHVAGVIVGSLAPLLAGMRVVILGGSGFRDRAVVEGLWSVVERHGVDTIVTVPTVLSALLDVPTGDHDVTSLRLTLCGASPVPVALTERWEERFGHRVITGYGLTEATCQSTLNDPNGPRKPGSVGTALPEQEVQVVTMAEDESLGKPCAVDEIGVVCVRGPSVFPGYKQADRNRGVLLDDGWLNTGDLGRLDDDGYLWITGRAKDLIKRGGHGIDPALIEEVLMQHPAVAVAAAVGRPDAYAGELPVAYVQLQAGAGPIDPEQVRLWCRETIPDPSACPVELIVVDAIPVTSVGKVSKVALRDDAAQRTVEGLVREALENTGATWTVQRGTDENGPFASVHLKDAPPGRGEALRQCLEALPLQIEITQAGS